jgi:hypothetical protein
VTDLLQKALTEVKKLPPSEQDALAAILLQELAAEERWTESFAKSQDALEVCPDADDWDGVERYAAALDDYTRPEPLPWSAFFIARGRALAVMESFPTARSRRSAPLVELLQSGRTVPCLRRCTFGQPSRDRLIAMIRGRMPVQIPIIRVN